MVAVDFWKVSMMSVERTSESRVMRQKDKRKNIKKCSGRDLNSGLATRKELLGDTRLQIPAVALSLPSSLTITSTNWDKYREYLYATCDQILRGSFEIW